MAGGDAEASRTPNATAPRPHPPPLRRRRRRGRSQRLLPLAHPLPHRPCLPRRDRCRSGRRSLRPLRINTSPSLSPCSFFRLLKLSFWLPSIARFPCDFRQLKESLAMEHNESGCEAPKCSILCINKCGFFGTAATMNMCSKCHKEMILNQEREKLAQSSIESFVNGSGSGKEPIVSDNANALVASAEVKPLTIQSSDVMGSSEVGETKTKEGPKRCASCKKRVGLTGFSCRCGNFFCAAHRYSDKHDCSFDYRTAAQNAIAKANPVIKMEKLDKI